MEEECFDLAVEGTTIRDLISADGVLKMVVFDRHAHYGTTYASVHALSASPYIDRLDVTVNKYTGPLSIEALPFLFGVNDSTVKTHKVKVFNNELEYAHIDEIYLFSDTFFRIPTSKNDILDLQIVGEDKFYIYRAIKQRSLIGLDSKLQCRKHPVYSVFTGVFTCFEQDFRKYCDGFGDSAFLYPIHGMCEISESVALLNSMKNTVYVLNETLVETQTNDEEHPCCLTCDLGVIKAKNIKRSSLCKKRWHVRVVLLQKQKFGGLFLGFIDSIKHVDRHCYIKVIGINSVAEICAEQAQIIYFICEHGPIPDLVFGRLEIDRGDIQLDVSFETIYDIDQFC